MGCLLDKKEWILGHERRFAVQLAKAVIDVPQLSLWTILIPIILVYHVFRHNRAIKGRTAFTEHYLLSRLWALEEACQSITEQREPDINAVAVKAVDLPAQARCAYCEWIDMLVSHFRDLLTVAGANYPALIQGVYHNRTHYLLFLHQLNQKEKALNAAVKNHLAATADVTETIARIEHCTAQLRRQDAELFFP